MIVLSLGVVVAALLIMGFVQLIIHLRKKDFRLDNSMMTAIPSGEVVKTVYLNPCVLVFLAYTTAGILSGLMNISLW